MIPARQLRSGAAACGNLERISSANPTATATTSRYKTHFGQAPSRTNSPFEKIDDGYLNRNSNMTKTVPRPNLIQTRPNFARDDTHELTVRGPSPCCLRSVRHSIHDVVEPD